MRRWILPLMTAALILSGAAMPYLVGRLQDSYTESWSERRELDSVRLSLRQELEVGQVLHLISGENIWLEWQSEKRLTEAQAAETVEELLTRLDEWDLLRGSAVGTLVSGENFFGEANLVVSSATKDLSAIIWSCYWDIALSADYETDRANAAVLSEQTGGSIRIDDATGQMVGLSIPASNGWRKQPMEGGRLKLCMSFLENYYNMEIREVEAEYVSPELCIYILRFDMGELGLCEVRLAYDEWNIYFNY